MYCAFVGGPLLPPPGSAATAGAATAGAHGARTRAAPRRLLRDGDVPEPVTPRLVNPLIAPAFTMSGHPTEARIRRPRPERHARVRTLALRAPPAPKRVREPLRQLARVHAIALDDPAAHRFHRPVHGRV